MDMPLSLEVEDDWESKSIFIDMPFAQYTALVAVASFSSVLSLLGSGCVIYLILSQQQWKSSFYERMVLGLSLADFLATTGIIAQPYFVEQREGLRFSIGNLHTCHFVGFFGGFFCLSFLYSSVLALVGWATVMLRREPHLRQQIQTIGDLVSNGAERLLHLTFWSVVVFFSAMLVGLDAFHPSPLTGSCGPIDLRTIVGYKPMERLRGVVLYVFTAILLVCLLIGLFCATCLYIKIRSLSPKRQFEQSAESHRSPANDSEDPTGQQEVIASYSLSVFSHSMSLTAPTAATAAVTSATTKADSAVVHGTDRRTSSLEEQLAIRQNRFLAGQALLYCLGFLNTIVPFSLFIVVSSIEGPTTSNTGTPILTHFMVFLFYMLMPLQGFVNCVIYLRPRLWRWRDAFPYRGWCWILVQIVRQEPMPSPTLRTLHLVPPNGQRGAVIALSDITAMPEQGNVQENNDMILYS